MDSSPLRKRTRRQDPRSRRAAWAALVLGAAAGTGCDSTTFYFYIDAGALSKQVENLGLEYTIDCKSPEQDINKSINRLDVAKVVIPSRSGLLRMTIWGYDKAGCKIGKYSLKRQLGGPDLCPQVEHISFSPMPEGGALCPVEITISGPEGNVQSLSTAPPLRCGAVAPSDSDECAAAPAQTEAAVPPVRECRGDFPMGAPLTLKADPPWRARWSEPCSPAQGDCAFMVKSPQKLRLSFASGPCSADGVCLEHPASLGDRLYSVSGKSSSNVWAVGSNGTTLFWDGSQWSYVPSGVSQPLFAVAGNRIPSSREVWAVGGSGTILHYDGKKWQQVPSPTSSALYGLWVDPSEKALWAVGAAGEIHLLEQPAQNTSWRRIGSEVSADLFSVSSTGADGVSETWAVGKDGLILRYDGTRFVRWPVRVTDKSLRSLLGLATRSVWAVGDSATCLEFNGTDWIPRTGIPPASGSLLGVAGQQNSPLWTASNLGELWRFDGTSWRSQDVPSSSGQQGIWRDTSGYTVSVGNDGVVLQSSNPETQAFQQIGTIETLRDLWRDPSRPEEVQWAVGDGGTILSRSGGSEGKQWVVETPKPTRYGLRRIWGPSAQSLWAVGDGATLLRRVGTHWEPLSTEGLDGESLVGISGQPGGSIWIAGSRGSILRCDTGPAPRCTTHSVSGELTDIWAASDSAVWAVGIKGRVLHFDGTRWEQQKSNTENDLLSIWGRSEREIWAVGGDGTVLAYDGTSWEHIFKGPPVYLRTVRGIDRAQGSGARPESDKRVWISGDAGVLMSWDGESWQTLQTGSTGALYGILPSIKGDGTEALWIAGDGGRIWSFYRRPSR
jgi:hypothetical protein